MDGFIHTISFVTNISTNDFEMLKDAYKEIFYCDEKKVHVLGKYSDRGLRIEIKNRDKEKEIKFDKKHRQKKVTMIFTIYKLLHNGKRMGAVYNKEDIIACVSQMFTLLKEINDQSGVDLYHDAKLRRVDVTCDVITPSEEYTKEIIRIAKMAMLPYGYKFWQPEKNTNCSSRWTGDNATFFNNHNQEIEAKVYNKKADLGASDLPENMEEKGLVRFELTLKRGFLKKHGYIMADTMNPNQLARMLMDITGETKQLLGEYVGNILTNGDMLSKKILFKCIERKYRGKNKRIEKMKHYVEILNNKGYDRISEYGSVNEVNTVEKYFVELGVSPIYTKRECPYIPSFERMFKGEVDRNYLNMAEKYNTKRQYTYVYWYVCNFEKI